MTIERINWINDGSLPDSAETVLIEWQHPDCVEVWIGYHDGEGWRNAESFPVDASVIAWAEIPAGSLLCEPDDEVQRLRTEAHGMRQIIGEQSAMIERLSVMLEAAQITASREIDRIATEAISKAAQR